MKSAILSIILYGLTYSSFGQSHKYIPFPDSNAIWVQKLLDEFGQLKLGYQYFIQKDTIINNVEYHKIVEAYDTLFNFTHWNWKGLRNDSVNKKVYIYDQGSQKEWLLYDFSLNEGDTVSLSWLGTGRYYLSVIDSIDTIKLNGNDHLVFYASYDLHQLAPYIEGVGSISGLFEETYFFEGGTELVCLMTGKDKIPYYTNGYDDCKLYHYTSIEENSPQKEGIEIIPNPINNSTLRLIAQNDQIMTIEIYTIGGKKLKSINVDSKEYKISNNIFSSKGIFIIKVQTIKGEIYFKKALNN